MKGRKMADTLKPIKCPACGKTMEKVFIPSAGINVDICTDGCGGIYFDNREFDMFDESNEDISKILEKVQSKEFAPVNEGMTRVCPNCGTKMVKNHSSVHQTIEVDDCYACGGKFLDNSELQKIRAEYQNNSERDEDILKYVYKEVGIELAEQDKRYAEIDPSKRTFLYKIFSHIVGL